MSVGIVEKKVEIRKEGIKPFDVLTINGNEFSCFKLSLSKNVREGDQVNYEFRESEGYKNITKLVPTGKYRPGVGPAGALKRSTQQDQIVREVALKAAAEFAKSQNLSYEDLLKVADEFVKWIQE